MAEFTRTVQSSFDGVVAAVRRTRVVSNMFSGTGLGTHFIASDADYIIGDFIAVLGLSLAFPLIRFLLQKAIFQPMATRLVGGAVYARTGRLPDKQRVKVAKFCESFWKLVVYGGFNALTLRAVIAEPWFRDTSYFWRDWPLHVPSVAVRQVYCGELAFMVASVFMLLFWETRRKDFPVMMTHHFATIALIALSYYLKFFRVGCMVLLTHDVSDVLMEGAKMCKYSGAEAASTALFVVFMFSWFTARLVYFPYYIIRSTLYENTEVLGYVIPFYHVLNGLLILLLVMHCYWFALITRIAYRTVVYGDIDDVREGGSDED